MTVRVDGTTAPRVADVEAPAAADDNVVAASSKQITVERAKLRVKGLFSNLNLVQRILPTQFSLDKTGLDDTLVQGETRCTIYLPNTVNGINISV